MVKLFELQIKPFRMHSFRLFYAHKFSLLFVVHFIIPVCIQIYVFVMAFPQVAITAQLKHQSLRLNTEVK